MANKLPVPALPTASVDIDGTAVAVRGLSRAEAFKTQTVYADDPDGSDTFIIACGLDVTFEEAAEWRNKVTFSTANVVMEKVVELSGLGGEDGKSPQPPTSEPS